MLTRLRFFDLTTRIVYLPIRILNPSYVSSGTNGLTRGGLDYSRLVPRYTGIEFTCRGLRAFVNLGIVQDTIGHSELVLHYRGDLSAQ
jgi:hypothetical protein